MIRTLACLALATGALFAWPKQAEAAESYDSCTGFIDSLPAYITTQGTWCLRKNLSTGMTFGRAISIEANNVTLDCNGFKIGGLAAGENTDAYGVVVTYPMHNATVRNCKIRGFRYGITIFSEDTGGHLVEGNRLDNNRSYGIDISSYSAGSTVRNTHVLDTGGHEDNNIAIGIDASGRVDIINNTVNGVVPTSNDTHMYGIRASQDAPVSSGSIIGNRVRGLQVPGDSGKAYGIHTLYGAVVKNIVQGPGPGGAVDSVGIRCLSKRSTAHQNVILGFDIGMGENCFTSAPGANSTNPN